MSGRLFDQPIEMLRDRFAPLLAGDVAARTKAVCDLKNIATSARRHGVADSESAPLLLLREAGVKPQPVKYALLHSLGLIDELVEAGVPPTGQIYVQRIFTFTGKTNYDQLTHDDVQLCAAAKGPKPCGPAGQEAFKRGLRKAIERVGELRASSGGPALINPIPIGNRRRREKPEDFPVSFRKDADSMDDALVAATAMDTTRDNYRRGFWQIASWLKDVDTDPDEWQRLRDVGPCVAMKDFARARRWIQFSARRHPSGMQKSGASVDAAIRPLLHMAMVAGLKRESADRFISQLKRSFRRNRSQRGKLDLLDVRWDPLLPMLSPDEICKIRASFATDLKNVTGGTAPHRRLFRDRLIFEFANAAGPRLASGHSLRADRLVMRSDKTWWFERVLVKYAYLRKRGPAVAEQRVGGRVYSAWVVPAHLVPMFFEYQRLEGNDLEGWIRSHGKDRAALRWQRADEPETYGPEAMSEEIAPLWFGNDGKYLSRGGFEAVIQRIIRERAGREAGAITLFRRCTSKAIQPLVNRDPRTSDVLLHHNKEMNDFYASQTDVLVAGAVGTYDPFADDGPKFTKATDPDAPRIDGAPKPRQRRKTPPPPNFSLKRVMG